MTEKTFDKDYEKGIEEDQEIEKEVSKLTIADKVVAKISRIAVNKVDGILDMKASFFDSVSSVFQSSSWTKRSKSKYANNLRIWKICPTYF